MILFEGVKTALKIITNSAIVIIISILLIKNNALKNERNTALAKVNELTIYTEKLSNNINLQNNSILEWQRQAKLAEEKIIETEKKRAFVMEESRKEANLIMHSNVSDDCEKAIDWGIEQARSFK